MKKLVVFLLLVSMMTVALCGCSATPKHFKGDWKFAKISKVEIGSNVSESVIADLFEEYGVADKKSVEESALAAFTADGTFAPCYLKFNGKQAYTYDPVMEREATWAFYQTGENEGFISVYTELNVADGNPDPVTNPAVVYDSENDTLSLTLKYAAFMVTVELTR